MPLLPVPLNVRASHQAVLEALPTTRGRPTLPVANATESFWMRSRSPGEVVWPAPAHGSEGPLTTTDADVCVVGAGMTGVSVAYHLGRMVAAAGDHSGGGGGGGMKVEIGRAHV